MKLLEKKEIELKDWAKIFLLLTGALKISRDEKKCKESKFVSSGMSICNQRFH